MRVIYRPNCGFPGLPDARLCEVAGLMFDVIEANEQRVASA